METGFPQLMLDLETLSSEPDAPIIQIGAVPFDIRSGEIGERFRVNVRPDFARTPPSLDTLCWWLRQDEGARMSVAQAEHGMLPAVACAAFEDFVTIHCIEKFELWAMPPEFDCVILANTFRSVSRRLPWRYNMTRDLRTLEALAGCTSADRVKPAVPHDAGSDAEAQARTAIAYWAKVFPASSSQMTGV
jgi:hypothetical protein